MAEEQPAEAASVTGAMAALRFASGTPRSRGRAMSVGSSQALRGLVGIRYRDLANRAIRRLRITLGAGVTIVGRPGVKSWAAKQQNRHQRHQQQPPAKP